MSFQAVTRKPRKGVLAKEMLAKTMAGDTSYQRTVSPDGRIESMILMHSRMGIRIEFNIHQNRLSLWISPQAGKSLDYRDRNFSCRDDHTSIFDRISFPELGAKIFEKCDYDPFHCVLHFQGQSLHLATLLDKPVVLLWTEQEEVVDLKSDKQDSLLHRTDRLFGVRHPDRGKVLDFCAALGKGTGVFLHQPEVDAGRSTYARVILPPRQLLVIGGELGSEDVPSIVTHVARRSLTPMLQANERLIVKALRPGTLILKNQPEMQKLYDMNKRHLLSVQDASGVVHAALKYVYYLIWSTDGAVTTTTMFQTGWHDYLERWLEFLLANPTSQDAPPHGRFYGQLVNGKITKREEFGSLCAVWPAVMYWGQTGNKRFVSGKYLRVLEDAVDWMERYCYDAEMKAIGTYYLGGGSEDPFHGSNDFGWDAAVGAPMSRNCYAPRHEGHLILRVYDFGMNLNQYNMYMMLSAATTGDKSEAYYRKARHIEEFLLKLLDLDARAYYLLDGKGMVLVRRQPGETETGRLAVQSQSPAFFMPEFARLYCNRMRDFQPLTAESVVGQMPCVAYGRLLGLDTEFVGEDLIVRSLEVSLPYHTRPSRFIPMPYTMVEVMGAPDGDFHDIRPQAFSAGPFQAAVTNLAIRTMPFGVALRATNVIQELNHFQYMGSHLDIRYSGSGAIRRILFNGKPLVHTLQVPDARVKPGANAVAVELAPEPAATVTLVYSTVRLNDVATDAATVRYLVTGYCQNVLVFRDVPGLVTVCDARGRQVPTTDTREGRHLFAEFEGKGDFVVAVGM